MKPQAWIEGEGGKEEEGRMARVSE